MKLRAPEGRPDCVVWDEEVLGFGIRFQNGAERGSYVVHFRVGSKQRKITIAKVGKIELEAARLEARDYLLKASKNIDPAVERTKAKSKVSKSIQPMIQPFLDHLQNDKNRAPSYVAENKRSLERYFARLHTLAPDDIDRETVADALRKIKANSGPIAMNRARSHLSKFYNWMIGEGSATHNPVVGTNKNDEAVRDRLLTEAELRIIWNACASDSDFDKIMRLLMLTAARRTQIGDLTRTEMNLDEAFIELAGRQGRTKNKQKFLLPLSRQAVAILKTVKAREESEFVFGEGNGGFSGWSKCKLRLDETLKELGVDNFVFHDFRAAFDTYAQDKLKIAPHITDLLLNHKGAEVRRGVRQHYNFANYLDEKVDAMDKWGDYIESLTKPKKPERKTTASNVVPITSRRSGSAQAERA